VRAQLARVDAVLVQAVIAATLSFAHLHDLASAAGQDGWKAWAYPVSGGPVVGGCLAAVEVRTGQGCGLVLVPRCPGRVARREHLHRRPSRPGRRARLASHPRAGWPALAFLGGTLLAHGSNEPAAAESSEPVVTAEREPTPSVEPVAEEPPALAPAEPESSAAPVPAALVAHARKVADAHEARTGARIDTATLRARLGVPAPLAEQIVAQLT
jgi:hypothetical protein